MCLTRCRWCAPARAGEVETEEVHAQLAELGFSAKMYTGPVASLSGGWKMKLALARAMLYKAQIMLLDEPTNHLDVKVGQLPSSLRSRMSPWPAPGVPVPLRGGMALRVTTSCEGFCTSRASGARCNSGRPFG